MCLCGVVHVLVLYSSDVGYRSSIVLTSFHRLQCVFDLENVSIRTEDWPVHLKSVKPLKTN